MSFENKEVTLLTWMAISRDPYLLDNTIYSLQNKTGYKVTKVAYLYRLGVQEDEKIRIPEKCDAVKKYLKEAGIEYIPFPQDVKGPTDHSEIFESMIKTLSPEKLAEKGIDSICINISAGTPAMNAVCRTLKNIHFFDNAKFYDVQSKSALIGLIPPQEFDSNKWIGSFNELWKRKENDVICEVRISRVPPKDEQTIKELPDDDHTFKELNSYAIGTTAHEEIKKNLAKYTKIKDAPILVLGERGIGKTTLIKSELTDLPTLSGGREVLHVNCAAWDDNTAGPEIFGTNGHAYTGDTGKPRPGCLEEANKKKAFLFFDEIHHLSRKWQRTLLTTMNDENHTYREMGSGKEKQAKGVSFIFASNIPLTELKNYLDEDFFDRISYFIIEIPPLRKYPNELEKHWNETWKIIRDKSSNKKTYPEKIEWTELKQFFKNEKNLMGNFRSLRRVAFNIIAEEPWDENKKIKSNELKKILKKISDFNEMELRSNKQDGANLQDPFGLPYNGELEGQKYTWKNVIAQFKKDFAKKACEKYGSYQKAAKELSCDRSSLSDAYPNFQKK